MKAASCCLLSSAVISAMPFTTSAQDIELIELDEIIVSAAGVAVDPLTAPASATVITSEQLEKMGASDLSDILRAVPGVAVVGSADAGNISIRGLPHDYTLILIDGKRQDTKESRTNGDGGVDRFFIPPVSSIERVEVIRGPASALHGSDAVGGVINIITKPVADTWGGSITAETKIPEDGEDAKENQTSFYLNGPLSDTVGLQVWGRSLNRGASQKPNGNSERQVKDLSARLTWAPSADHKFTFDLGSSEVDADPRVHHRDSAALGYEGMIGAWDVTADLSFEKAVRNLTGSDRRPVLKNTIVEAKASRSFYAAGYHQFTIGGQYSKSELSDWNTGLGDSTHYNFVNSQWAIFAEDIWEISDRITLTLGGRYTDDERFGGKLTPRAYALYELSEGFFLNAGVSTGYRTPEIRDANDNYYLSSNRGRAAIQGNSDLKPEESTNYELGFRFENATTNVSATLFQTDFINKIESVDQGTTVTLGSSTVDLYQYQNVDKARIKGVEISASHLLTPTLELSGTYTRTDSERLSGTLAGQPLSRTPEVQASLRLDWQTPVDGLEVWGQANHTGKAVNAALRGTRTTLTEYDAYSTLDIGANYAFNDTTRLNAAIYNVTDLAITHADHGTVKNGRTLWIGFTKEF